ncbi:MAG: phosphate ABC transporter ATP-binding protein PstB [candidate division WOR-3 bacterium]|nr:phosphate ABC transporter ATP-binding protein PstB [candidate division WOR-3 bacterium]MCX7836772.1 phosphate ABC transporter ATP-binding protein PstB [candidate division WOR-3 bacterium]MDW8113590.1 phosphate ABC transporter ATP-binding protein PstB [candidate division WOR-3 bacterium]
MKIKIKFENFSLWFGNNQILKNINLEIPEKNVTAIMGPSGCGKTTLLRAINRMNDLIPDTKVCGKVFIDNENIYDANVNLLTLRKKVGMVFQKPNPFPKSIYENIAFGLKVHKFKNIKERVTKALIDANLYDEVKDNLYRSALNLSGGQQQRLCIARAIAIEPEIILLDEPASALDPIATAKLEELIHKLKKEYTIVIVTHNMQQAARVSDYCAFMYLGELVEFGKTEDIFVRPKDKRTEDFLLGKYG